MSDENETGQGADGSREVDAINAMTDRLAGAIEGVRSDARDEALKAVTEFADTLEEKRSRRAPVPPQANAERDRGGVVEVDTIRVIGDGSAPLYRRMESGRSPEEVADLRAARNGGMDRLTAEWAQHVETGNVEGRIRSYNELNDAYLKGMGVGSKQRAELLEGVPNASSGFADGTGAELLPLPLASQLVAARDVASKFRALVNVFPMTTQTQRIPVMPIVSAATRAENASYSDATPDPSSALLSAKDLGVSFSAGRNFTEDTGFNVANQLTVVAGGAIGSAEDSQIATSNGTAPNITESLTSATITVVAEATGGALVDDDIYKLYYALSEQYRREACFFANANTLQDIMTVGDSVNRPVFLNAVNAPVAMTDADPAATGRLLGKPIYEISSLADSKIFFGNPQWYALGNRTGIRVDTERAVGTGLRTWVIDERIDGRCIPTAAVNTNDAWREMDYAS